MFLTGLEIYKNENKNPWKPRNEKLVFVKCFELLKMTSIAAVTVVW